MPRENKKRGRWAEAQKHKADEDESFRESYDISCAKRRKTLHNDRLEQRKHENEQETYDTGGEGGGMEERVFYGLLDEQEQEYFKRTDGMLEINQFSSLEERTLFLENVYKEAEGKELKLACSQSCSKLLERLILLSTPAQLKHLFQKFRGHFLGLSQHRFASHCCETLFVQSAPIVTEEFLQATSQKFTFAEEEPLASMESMFLHAFHELSGNLGYLIIDRFASHTIRVLLIIFAGEPLGSLSRSSLLSSRRKEQVDVSRTERTKELILETHMVPDSFSNTLKHMMSESLKNLEPHYLQTLATHPIANPVLQLLVQLEMTHFDKQMVKDDKSVTRRLLPDQPISEGSPSANFVNSLLYDTIGSRLLETIIIHAPGKMFKALFKEIFKGRMGSIVRSEIASYVASRILERLNAEDLRAAHDAIIPQIHALAQRGRTTVIRSLVERCAIRGVDMNILRDTILSCWADDDGRSFSIAKMLDIPETSSSKTPRKNHSSEPTNNAAKPISLLASTSAPPDGTITPNVLHRSLLAQTMISTPGPLAEMLFAAISNLSSAACLHIANVAILSPVLQQSLTVPHASLIFRRKLITRFYSHIGDLAMHQSGSHLVDAIWAGTLGMAFVRERIAEELAENETPLRVSDTGKKVWRNWRMDLYKRRRAEWVRMVRGEVGNDGFQSFPDGVLGNESGGSWRTSSLRGYKFQGGVVRQKHKHAADSMPKTNLDLARERHALARQKSALSDRSSNHSGKRATRAPM